MPKLTFVMRGSIELSEADLLECLNSNMSLHQVVRDSLDEAPAATFSNADIDVVELDESARTAVRKHMLDQSSPTFNPTWFPL